MPIICHSDTEKKRGIYSFDDPNWQTEFFSNARVEALRLPKRLRDCSIDNFSPDGVYKRFRAAADKFIESWKESRKGIIFYGPCGSGKTHLAIAILKELVKKGAKGAFCRVNVLGKDLRIAMNADDTSADIIVEDLIKAKILVLDDIGAARDTAYLSEQIELILSERHSEMRTTLITTNYDMRDEKTMKHILGERLMSRLHEMCAFAGPFPNVDWRK